MVFLILKARANERNMAMAQHRPTLLGKCCAMLAKGVQTITTFWAMLRTVIPQRSLGSIFTQNSLRNRRMKHSVRTREPNNVVRTVQTNPTCCDMLHRSRKQKKCWQMLGKKFDWFQTSRNMCQHHATLSNMVYKRTQHVVPCALLQKRFG